MSSISKCVADGCSRDQWYDINRGEYSSFCGNTCRLKKPTVVKNICISTGCSRPQWYDINRGEYSSFCGNTCRLKVSVQKCGCCEENRTKFCVCGKCNYCHLGGWDLGPNNYVDKVTDNARAYNHWYASSGVAKPVICGQSHGGHGYIPDV